MTNSAADAFLTIQKAIDTVADKVDIRGVDVTIQVADGAYNAPVLLRPYVGRTTNPYGVTLRGNPATPGNVTIDLTSGACISGFATPVWTIDGFSLATSATYCVSANACQIAVRAMTYRASGLSHVRSIFQGSVLLLTSYTIAGGAQRHLLSDAAAMVFINSGVSVSLAGTPAFSVAFAHASTTAIINAGAVTFSGSATGTKYLASLNAVIATGGGAGFPGSVPGITETGGQYS